MAEEVTYWLGVKVRYYRYDELVEQNMKSTDLNLSDARFAHYSDSSITISILTLPFGARVGRRHVRRSILSFSSVIYRKSRFKEGTPIRGVEAGKRWGWSNIYEGCIVLGC